jgi:hypothetical protein
MVPVTALWLPIIVAAAIVFVASSVIHMVLGYHAADYGELPGEDDVQAALRKFNLPPGDYMLPCPGSPKEGQSQAFIEKMKRGPVAMISIWPNASMSMARELPMWFVYSLVVGLFAGYVAGIVLPRGADYMVVFRITGTVAFVGYALALWQHSIWYRRSWSTTIRSTIDGAIYGLLTAGAFGWLWPR